MSEFNCHGEIFYRLGWGSTATQRDVYESVCEEVVELASSTEDASGIIIMYGQSGSGKSHTMLGEQGVLETALAELFRLKTIEDKAWSAQPVMTLQVSIFEVAGVTILDLIKKKQVQSLNKVGNLDGLCAHPLASLDYTKKFIQKVLKGRKTAKTDLNEHSSRTHLFIQLQITRTNQNSSTLTLVDLAGSEKSQRGLNKQRDREGALINTSLLALGKCFRAITSGTKPPWNESSLTKILKCYLARLDATHRIALVACIQPDKTETKNTMLFAAQALKPRPRQVEKKATHPGSRASAHGQQERQALEEEFRAKLQQQREEMEAKLLQQRQEMEEKLKQQREELEDRLQQQNQAWQDRYKKKSVAFQELNEQHKQLKAAHSALDKENKLLKSRSGHGQQGQRRQSNTLPATGSDDSDFSGPPSATPGPPAGARKPPSRRSAGRIPTPPPPSASTGTCTGQLTTSAGTPSSATTTSASTGTCTGQPTTSAATTSTTKSCPANSSSSPPRKPAGARGADSQSK